MGTKRETELQTAKDIAEILEKIRIIYDHLGLEEEHESEDV